MIILLEPSKITKLSETTSLIILVILVNLLLVMNIKVRKLTFTDKQGDGFFREGDVIRTRDTKAEIIGFSQARNTLYLGKIGRCQRNGADYHQVNFVKSTINTYNKKFGSGSLALSPGTSTHTFVSGVADAITVTGGASGPFTAATGTTYNPLTGEWLLRLALTLLQHQYCYHCK